MSKLWGGRFTKDTNELVDLYTSSINFDKKMYAEDIKGSIAHATMLGECLILPSDEVKLIIDGLNIILTKIENNEVEFQVKHEDIHMNIEKLLIDEIGAVGGKLHTGRSRNDQVATDMHIYLYDKTNYIISLIEDVQDSILSQAKEHMTTLMPGYTHLQRAQPISFAHHILTYFWMLQRDKERFQDSLKRINILPLGAGALAGTTFSINRELVANLLDFDGVYPNSMDAVSDRDFIVEFLSHSSIMMVHISRLCEELILWSSDEFKFIELDDAYCTGSSIMPQKKNPDVPELLRAKTGRVVGNLVGLITVLKGLPLAYNKDMQEDKEGMFDTVETLEGGLPLLSNLIHTMKVLTSNMEHAVHSDYSNATDLADYLVGKDIPFREAHEIVGKTVLYAIGQSKYLLDLSLQEYQAIHPSFEEDIFTAIQPRTVMDARISQGGTSTNAVQVQLQLAEMKLAK